MKKGIEDIVTSLLDSAGVKVNGNGDADIQVKHPDFYKRVLRDGTLGFGESYMDGWWDSKKLDELICKILNAHLEEEVKSLKMLMHYWEAVLFNWGKKTKAFEVGEKH